MRIDTTIPKEFLKVSPERDDYVINICSGKKVLHVGATDYPFTEEKFNNGQLLYTKLGEVAAEQLGIDNNKKSSEFLNEKKVKNSEIIIADMNEINQFDFVPEIVLFGETLEHLMNLEISLTNLKKLMSDHTLMVISVPNALSFLNFIYSLRRRELQHPDHSVAFTYKTLTQLMSKNELQVVDFKFTFLDNTNAFDLNWKGKLGHSLLKIMTHVSPVFAPGLIVVVKKSEK